MKARILGHGILALAAVAALAACSPPASELPPDEAEPRAERVAPPSAPSSARSETRAERRPAASAPTSGEYKYIDERGRVQLAARLEDIPESQRSTASRIGSPAAAARSRAPADDVRAVNDVDVTIFTTSSCGYCRAAMAHFDKLGLDYTNRDVEQDEEARAEYLELTGGRRGVPVIVVGESWIQGWSRPEFDRLLASAR